MSLKQKKIEALSMLASGMKQSEIADRLNISVKTVQRWKNDSLDVDSKLLLKTIEENTVISSKYVDFSEEDYAASVQLYKEQYENIGSDLVEMALLSLRLGLDAIARLSPEDVGLRQIESLMRTATLCGRLGLQLKTELIGKIQTENSLVDDFSGEETAEQLIAEHTRLISTLSIDESGNDSLPKVF
jgi:transcriptional regulator with XRE-family HTH domain